MAYLTETEILERAARITRPLRKSAGQILLEATASADESFDVFLSHSSAEPEEILLGVKAVLEDRGIKVYVDKYSDPQLTPDEVTPETAELLRSRMRCSNALLYLYSRHSQKSRWMPWELGFFDGLKGNVGILPVTQNQEETFKGGKRPVSPALFVFSRWD
ncbi:MAG: toll/interleukin-1 receptor domain-containing protein [Aestuariivirga sp.]